MSGTNLAYQLRPNKAVDRNLFIDLLNKLNRIVNISDYTYFGFGGPFLEDFKLMHAHLRVNRMVSIEEDEFVHQRQKFNSPLNCIDFARTTSNDFILNNDFNDPSIFWLDYVTPGELGNQLNEIQFLLSKLKNDDIFKVTVNCNPATLGDAEPGESIHETRLRKLEARIGDYLPATTTANDMVRSRYSSVLLHAISIAVQKGMSGKPHSYFQVLSAFTYQDGGHPMLTVTGIILENSEERIESFFNTTRVRNWPVGVFDWNTPKIINVPELSVKERIYIDNLLPESNVDNIIGKLEYIDPENQEMKGLIENYINYYRMYPLFSRVVI